MPEDILLFIRSEKAPVWAGKVKTYYHMGLGTPLTKEDSHVVYEYLLDEYQEHLVYEVGQIAERLNIEIRVIDIGKTNRVYGALLKTISKMCKRDSTVFSPTAKPK